MSDGQKIQHENTYRNAVIGATPNPVMENPDTIDAQFAERANDVLQSAAELIRVLIGAHQSAIAIIVQRDWRFVRKFFSLSSKYADWAEYRTPATGYGIHAWILERDTPIRLTQAELEAHPEWKNFGTESAQHPPMRGWLAAPLLDRQGTNWGLIQLSDKYEGDFSAEDEQQFTRFAHMISMHLEALWEIRNLQKAAVGTTADQG